MRLESLVVFGFLSASTYGRDPRGGPYGRPPAEHDNEGEVSYISTDYRYAPSPVGPHLQPGYTITSPGTGTAPTVATPTPPSNSSENVCSGQTLNVLDASLDWWYSRTLYNYVSTISIQYNRNDSQTGWTLLPATTTFNLSSALASPTCVSSSASYNTEYNVTMYDYSCGPVPTPVAADTTILSQTAFRTLNASTGVGVPPKVATTPPPASLTIPNSAYPEGTPFVYFIAYEIMNKSQTTYRNGSVGCAAATQTINMEEPFSFEYTGGDVNGSLAVGAGVTGDINPAFLQVVGQTNAKAGSWVAAPTVAMVVQDIMIQEAVLAKVAGPNMPPVMTTETILQTPSATLPTIDIPPPPTSQGGGNKPIPPGHPGNVEPTETSLDIPTPIGGGKPPKETKPPPANTGKGNGQPSSPHKPPKEGNPNEGKPKPGKGAGIGHIVSQIISAVKPTNALQVFQQAQNTEKPNPTALAIVNGIGGPGAHQGPGSNHNDFMGTGPNGQRIIVVGGTTFHGDSSTHFNMGAAGTLTPGGTAVVNGNTVSLAPGATAMAVNGEMHMAGAMVTSAPSLTIDGHVYAPNGGATYNIDGQQLTPGGVVTMDGTTISLMPGASAVVVDGVTQTLGGAAAASITAAPILMIGGETFTASNGNYVINGETLTPGEQETVVVDGKTYIVSLNPGASVLMIETEGPGGAVTATSYETLNAAGGSAATATKTANPGASASSNPTQGVQEASTNIASSFSLHFSGFCMALGSLALAIWL